jgi:hypothetical protein
VILVGYYHHAEIVVTCPGEDIQQIMQFVFYSNYYSVCWQSPVEGFAQQLSGTGKYPLGPKVQWYEFVIQIFPMPDRKYTIRLIKSFRGITSNAVGWWDQNLIEKKFIEIVDKMSSYFHSIGRHENTLFF